MVIFHSRYIEQQIRENLNTSNDHALMPDDLQAITGIQISDSDTNITPCGWHDTVSMYQMTLPNLFLNYNEFSMSEG